MRVPVWIKPMVWGAVLGAIGCMVVGFGWMGWTLDHTSKRLVDEGRQAAVIATLTPFCVSNYLKQPDAAQKLAALNADSSPYARRDIVEKSGFATIAGTTEPSSDLATSCAAALATASVAGAERPAAATAIK